ncbi:hypothetical protein JCM3774_004184 [Rhodotorula dairenensis]
MATPALAASLAQLTGLDVATAQEQLLPHLDSLKSSNEVKNYLDSLLAPGPAAQQFVAMYTAYRFPSAPTSSNNSASRAGGTSSWANRNGASAATASSSAASSRAASPAHGRISREKDLDRAAKTAPKGGKVYIKEREDQLDQQWGGKASRHASRPTSAQRMPPPVPIVAPTPAAGPASQAHPTRSEASLLQYQNKGKGKAAQGHVPEAETELSEEGAAELLRIEKALRGFEARKGGQMRTCFCQARQHPLATYAPLCPRCSLVLCVINLPSSPCPSCSHSPLLSSAATATHIASLQSAREDLLAREKRRVQLAKAQEERERAAIRFPDLGAADARAPIPGGGRSYAGHAGGGSSMSDRIDRAYEARAAQLAAASKGGNSSGSPPRAGRVLRLDGKTGKVKVQTKVVKPSSAGSKGRGKATVTEEETIAVMDAEDDDGLVSWIDEDDDGVRGQPSVRSVLGEAIAQRPRPAGRPFANVTLPEDEWPTWVPAGDENRLDEDDLEGGAADGGVAYSGAVRPLGSGEPPTPPARPARPAVPGAAAPADENAKSKRRRGRGPKEKGQGAAATETTADT